MRGPGATGEGPAPLTRFLVGYDASEPAQHAALLALRLAAPLKAKVWLLYATGGSSARAEPVPREVEEARRTAVLSALRHLEGTGRSLGVPVEPVLSDDLPLAALLRLVRELPADLLLVGARGLSAPQRLALGSVSSRLVSEARIPVLVVP